MEPAAARIRSASLPDGLQLAPDLEFLRGPEDQRLLFIHHRGVYLRLNRPGAEAIERLLLNQDANGAAAAIESVWPGGDPNNSLEFLDQLIRSGAIVDANHPTEPIAQPKCRISCNPRSRLPLRLRFLCPDRVLFESVVRWIRAVPETIRRLVLLLAAASVCVGLTNLSSASEVNWREPVWSVVVTFMVIHMLLHECSHVLACSLANVKVREAGIGILYWFLPVFYIDRTDSYRVHRKASRIAIPLAGPVFDLCAAGVTAICACCTSGVTRATFETVSLLESLLFVINLNPLLPTDGFHAIEAILGRTNTRKRAFQFLLWRLGLRPLPSSLAALRARERRAYMIYGAASAVYIAVLAFVATVQSPGIARFVLEHFR